mgnify:CR=1 FL=1
MPNVNQLYTVLNAVAAQALGSAAVTVTDTRSMIALGDAVLSSSDNKDAFVGALMDRIGRTIVSMRVYDPAGVNPLIKKPFEYGCVLQKIYVDLEDANPNNEWNIGAQDYTPAFAPVFKPDVRQKLFNALNAWEYDWTVPDNILKTAFISEENMQSFFTAQVVAMDNSLKLSLENAANLVRATGAAYHIENAGATAINLLAEYLTIHQSSTLTASDCLYDQDFLRYAAMRILNVTKYMRKMSRIWNLEGFARHTDTDYAVVTLLQDFDSAESMYLQADTFHNELVALKGYNVVPYWQGAGNAGNDFANASKIAVKIKDGASSKDVTQTGVVAIVHDIEAIGTTLYEIEQSSQRNNKDRYTDFFNHANIGYFFDPSENFVVFYIANPT